jgi:hypothetical protein
MAKKSRRVRRKGTGPRLSETQLVQPTQAAAKEALRDVEVLTREPAKQPTQADLQKEYQYVVSDMKRLGLLAAAILGGMLVLYFIL